jgi:hypothetical protein
MLQVPELKRAMGFSNDYKLLRGTRRDRIKLLGNGVCPPVMQKIVADLTGITRTIPRDSAIVAPRPSLEMPVLYSPDCKRASDRRVTVHWMLTIFGNNRPVRTGTAARV